MSEAVLNYPGTIPLAKEREQLAKKIVVYHQTPKEQVASILEHGLRSGEKPKGLTIWGRANKLIDFYCRLFGVPVDRSHSTYSSLEDPRIEDVDNNVSYDEDKHAVIAVSVNSKDVYVAESDHYAMVLAYLSEFSFVKAHVQAIKYARSIQRYDDYKRNGPKQRYDVSAPKPEVLIARHIPTSSLKVM